MFILTFNYEKIGIPLTIFLPLIIGYAITSDVYCIFTDTFISDIFMHIASFSIKFPRLIFTFNLEGFAWLIAMKLLFAAIGFIVGILVIILAVGVSSLFSIFVFIPAVIKDHKR